MNFVWKQFFRLPQTYFLWVGIGIGGLGLVLWLGSRWIVFAAATGVGVLMLVAWIQVLSQIGASDNLLDRQVFLSQLGAIGASPAGGSKQAAQARQWADAAQAAATRIAERDPTLTADLLETLFTVLALVRQVVEATQALDQVQTPTYQALTQKRLQNSSERLQQTSEQLQALQDQLVVTGLDQAALSTSTELPSQLQSVIDLNKMALQALPDEKV
jgi:hypothetical protein